jgi:hypothetical protein
MILVAPTSGRASRVGSNSTRSESKIFILSGLGPKTLDTMSFSYK